MIKARRDIHQHPEGGFKEYRTQEKLKGILRGFGIKEKDIKVCAQTGLVVDIRGTAKGSSNSKGEEAATVSSVALRADMDGLPIPENNPHLDYKSETDFAHLCGHDGHMVILLSAAQVIFNNRGMIPEEKLVRLLFQPAEEGPGGAKVMVEEGCLESIDEVYGFHNVPNFDEGDIRVCEGGFFAAST